MDSNYANFIVRCLVEHLNLPLDEQQTISTLKFHSRHLPAAAHEDFGSIVLLECSQEGAIDDRDFRRLCDRVAHRLSYRAKKASQVIRAGASSVDAIAVDQSRLDEQQADNREAIQDALKLVDPSERIIVQLRFIDEMTLQQIGDRLGLTISQVRTRLTRTLTQLRASLKRDVR